MASLTAKLAGQQATPLPVTVVAPGDRRAAALNACFAALSALYAADGRQRRVRLFDSYSLEAKLVLPSGVRVQCDPGALFTPTGALTGAVDDPANQMLEATGAASGAVATTTSVILKDGASVAVNAVPPGLVAGDFVQVFGNNLSSNSSSDSDGPTVVLSELIKVASIVGTTVNFATPAMQYHASGVSVQKYVPVRDVAWDGGYFDGSGAQMAGAMRIRGALGWRLGDSRTVAFRGFTRRAVEVDTGAADYAVGELLSDGLNNGLLGLSSTGPGLVDTLRTVRGRERENLAAGAIPRGMLYMNHRCTAVRFNTVKFETVAIGVRIFGGRELSFGDAWIDDVDPANAIARSEAANEMDSGGTVGGGWTMDTGVAANDEVCQGLKIDVLNVGYVKSPVGHFKRWWSIFLHDTRWLNAKTVRVVNNGGSSGYQCGIYIRDTSGWIDVMEASGVWYGYYATGQYYGVFVSRYAYNGSTGDSAGLTEGYALLLDTEGRVGFRIDSLEIGNVNFGYLELGPLFVAQPDWDLEIGRIQSPEGVFGRSVLARGGTVGAPIASTMGDLVELDQAGIAGERQFKLSAAANPRGAVVSLTQYRNGGGPDSLALVAPLPSEVDSHVLVSGAGNVGDLVAQGGTNRQAVVNNAPGAYNAIGRLLDKKTAGGAALARVRRA